MKENKIKYMKKKDKGFHVVLISLFVFLIILDITMISISSIMVSISDSNNQLEVGKNLMILKSIQFLQIFAPQTPGIPFGDFFLLFIPLGIAMVILMLIKKRKLKIKH